MPPMPRNYNPHREPSGAMVVAALGAVPLLIVTGWLAMHLIRYGSAAVLALGVWAGVA